MYYNLIQFDWFPGHICICCWCVANLVAVCTYVTVVYSIVCCHKSTPLLKTFKKLTFRYIVYKYKVSQHTCLVCSSSSRAASAMSFSFLTAVCLSSSSWCLTSRNCSWCLTCTQMFHMEIGAAKLCAWSSTWMWSCYVCNYTHIHAFASDM